MMQETWKGKTVATGYYAGPHQRAVRTYKERAFGPFSMLKEQHRHRNPKPRRKLLHNAPKVKVHHRNTYNAFDQISPDPPALAAATAPFVVPMPPLLLQPSPPLALLPLAPQRP